MEDDWQAFMEYMDSMIDSIEDDYVREKIVWRCAAILNMRTVDLSFNTILHKYIEDYARWKELKENINYVLYRYNKDKEKHDFIKKFRKPNDK